MVLIVSGSSVVVKTPVLPPTCEISVNETGLNPAVSLKIPVAPSVDSTMTTVGVPAIVV